MKKYSAAMAVDFSYLPVLKSLGRSQVESLFPYFTIHTFAKNAFVFRPGDECSHLYFLLNGMVKKGIVSTDDRELTQDLILPNQLFGYGCLAGEKEQRSFTKVIGGKATILMLPIQMVKELIVLNDQIRSGFVTEMAKAICQSERRLEMLLTSDVRTRFAHFLKEKNIDFTVPSINKLLESGLTQQDIASMIGATRQTVALLVSEIRREG
jgi:CRP-like cAMP-binding protein